MWHGRLVNVEGWRGHGLLIVWFACSQDWCWHNQVNFEELRGCGFPIVWFENYQDWHSHDQVNVRCFSFYTLSSVEVHNDRS